MRFGVLPISEEAFPKPLDILGLFRNLRVTQYSSPALPVSGFHTQTGHLTSSEGKVYALNGNASDSKKYRGLFKIWKENPEIPGTRIPVGDIISRGLKLCR